MAETKTQINAKKLIESLTENQKTNSFICQICKKIFTVESDKANETMPYSYKTFCDEFDRETYNDDDYGCSRTFCDECQKDFIIKCRDCGCSLHCCFCVDKIENYCSVCKEPLCDYCCMSLNNGNVGCIDCCEEETRKISKEEDKEKQKKKKRKINV